MLKLKLQPAVKQETLRIAVGTFALCCVMLLVFLLIGQLNVTVLLGTLLGYAAAVANFFFMALTIQRAVENVKQESVSAQEAEAPSTPAAQDEADDEDAKKPSPLSRQTKNLIQLSYNLRMIMLVCVGVLALAVDAFHPVATLLCLLFPRVVILVIGQMDKRAETEG